MRLWTMQTLPAYRSLIDNGYFICDEKYADRDFTSAYKWLMGQMDKKGIYHPINCKTPIWAWYRYNGKNKKPDLRNSGFGIRGTKSVCIELEIPENDVLLSDYTDWHRVLNNGYNDNSNNEQEWEKETSWYESLSGKNKQLVKIKSWEKIFDIPTVPYKNDWRSYGYWVQATFWVIRIEDIVKVQTFICK